MSLPLEISVADLKRMHDDNRTFILMDVREDEEVATASIPWAQHVRMGTVPDRLGEFSKDGDIVVMCHAGARSGRVAQYLRDQGFASVANLAGGIDAWSVQIDSTVPKY